MRFSTAIVGLSMATAFTTPSVTIRIHPSTTSARISLEDLSDKLIADNATGDNAAKLALLQQNYKGLVSSTIPALQDLVEGTSTTLNIAAYGPWYVAAACLFVAASQRSAGRDEARSELVEKIVKGELNVEEMVQKIKEEEEAAARAKAEQEAIQAEIEEDARLAREAEIKRLTEARLAQEAALAARKSMLLEAEQERQTQREAVHLAAQEKKQAAEDALLAKAKELRVALEANRVETEAKKQAERLEAEAQKQAAANSLRLDAEERRAAIETKRIEAEAKKLEEDEAKLLEAEAKAEDRRVAAKAKRLAAKEKKKAAEDAIRIKAEERLAAIEAKRLEAEDKKLAALRKTIAAERLEVKRLAAEEAARAAEEARRLEEEETQRIAAEKETAKRLLQEKKEHEAEQRRLYGVQASSLARVLAREYGLDILTIPGSGKGGRVLADDVTRLLPPKETVPTVDETVDFFFTEPTEEVQDEYDIDERGSGLFSALKNKTETQLRAYLSERGLSFRDEDGKLLRKAELILEVLEQSYASREKRNLTEE